MEGKELIDNIFTNRSHYEHNSGLIISDINDHLPVFLICKHNYEKQTFDEVYIRNVNKITITKLSLELEQADWSNILTTANPDSAYDNFIETFKSLHDKCIPLIKRKQKTYT